MKRFLWITLCLCVTLNTLAQKQQGIVRTIERPGQKSVGINGVTIKINEYPNAIVSGKGGKFSFTLQGKKQGDRCLVTRVEKKGYTLIDKMPSFAYSFSTPAEIVMVSNKQLQQDEKKIRDKAQKEAEANYHKRIADLERQLQEKTISEEKYREQLQHVFDGYKNYLKMIDEMARRYAITDYKGISEINRQIQECIENAELERADSLINSKGDINRRKKKLEEKRDLKQKLDSLQLTLQQEIDFSTNELANDFFTKHLICASRYDNDSAAYYLEERASLDTTNLDWIYDVGEYLEVYIANYSLALKYFQRGLKLALNQDDELNRRVALFYYKIASVYDHIGDFNKALINDFKALDIRKQILDADDPDIALSYNNIGVVYYNIGNYEKSLEFSKKALDIRKRMLGEEHALVALSYNNIGAAYDNQGNIEKALGYYQMAHDINKRLLGNEHHYTAMTYNNIGQTYLELAYYDKALDSIFCALDIDKRVLGPYHPDTARDYNSIGAIYDRQGNYEKALEYYFQALTVWKYILGPDHPNVAWSYFNIGGVYGCQGNLAKALEYFSLALDIRERKLGLGHPDVATSYYSIGQAYFELGEYMIALDYYQKALNIYKQIMGIEHLKTQKVKAKIDEMKELMGQ